MKRGVLAFVGCAMLLSMGLSLSAAVPVTVMNLKTIKPVDTFYTGELESISKSTYSFENSGNLEYIVQEGDYVFAPIVAEDGSFIREGTLLARQALRKLEYDLKAAIMAKKITEADYETAKRDFTRTQRLYSTNRGIISQKEYQTTKTALMTAKINLDKAINDVLVKQYAVDRASLYPTFSGMVTKVSMVVGAKAGDGDAAVEVTRMSPLLVKIPFPENIVNNFKEGTVAKVYPAGIDEPSYAWCTTSLSNDMIFAYVGNKVMPCEKLSPEQMKMKKVYSFFPVVDTSDSRKVIGNYLDSMNMEMPKINQNIAVPAEAIRKDAKGTYILKVSADSYNLKNNTANLSQFKVQKIYVKIGDIKREYCLGLGRDVVLESLADAGGLEVSDILVLKADKDIKDGETVIKENVRWEFMPGQSVRLEVPVLSDEGIYVPASAVINQVTGEDYVYLMKNGKAKLVEVRITGRSSGYNRIVGEGIEDGDQVIVLDRDGECNQLYDGVSVEAKKTLDAPVRITRPRVDKLAMSPSDIQGTYYSK